ncbi:MAG TPA: hypothetical protein VD833_17985 [Vicinamibacterales bacterium]|nr:hypothetical protein [Vicinamibacterales bacterium]
MRIAIRTLFVLTCAGVLVAAACGGSSPTEPSGSTGATVAGMVSRTSGPLQGLTVSVPGSSLSTTVESSGYFQLRSVPSGNIQLKFQDSSVDATAQLSNVGQNQFIEIQVQVSGTTATIVSETRSEGKVELCHKEGNGTYHLIDVSVNAESAHRAHGDAKVGEPVPGAQNPNQVFDENCRVVGPAVTIEKSTNGRDADSAPGPEIVVGSAVNWTYVVTNVGTVALSGVTVSDDKGVAVSCPKASLSPGESMTCTGSGTATPGQYRNVGRVNASSSSGDVSDTDPSHYLGVTEQQDEGPKVQLCHKTGAGFFVHIEVAQSAVPAHLAHGDGRPGEEVPGTTTGQRFSATCSVQ